MSSGSSFRAALAALVVVIVGLVALYFGVSQRERQPKLINVPADEYLEAAQAQAAAGGADTLRVCADPNNLPFSNQRGEGFENRLAELIAAELGRKVSYTWWPQRRGFVRNTLRARRCDIVMGVPTQFEMLQTTAPYYRSAYVFVTRAADELELHSLDDPQLRRLRIGLHAIGDDYSNVPPAQALADRGVVGNVRGYSIYGDYSQPDPPRALIDALAAGEIDVAIAWGPLAGYFAQRSAEPLELSRIADPADPRAPLEFDISMGVRRGEPQFKAEVEQAMAAIAPQVESLLRSYGAPLVASSRTLQVADYGG